MEDLRAGGLSIHLIDAPAAGGAGTPLRLEWSGASTERQPELILAPFFAQVLDAAPPAGVEMRFDKLDHFNSSTITALIQLIHGARARRVRLVMRYDPQRKWQKLSFEALRAFEQSDALLEIRSQ